MKAVIVLLLALVGWGLVGGGVTAPSYAAPAEPDVTVEPGTGFTRAQVDEIRALVADAKIRTRVLILNDLPKSAKGSPDLHASNLELARFKKDDERVGMTLVFTPDTIPEYGAYDSSLDKDVIYALSVVEKDLDGTPQEKFVELVEMTTTRTGAQRMDEEMAKIWEEPELSSQDTGGSKEPASTKVLVLRWVFVAVVAVLVLLFVGFRGRAVAGWWKRRRRARGIEEAAGEAREKTLADRAKADLAAFGAAIDAESMDQHDALPLWNLALDDYDKASRLYDARTGAADDRKVIEICARGRDRLAKAQR
ncbi:MULTISPECIES: hypothetical protein [unclassified Nocardioides]|uniref:hypothetical protein n=1 Tax=unclassified Nocardioides TaxID=2615069 RepID=UPI0006F31A96|nr:MULTISPECIES: hypothetical protein [unclassified Nocardioides]KQY63587.1 hypothetical protein ASD30_00820 [Nocardioides sp. Root140]KRF15604.1 hypothetical protein ASH02_02820 [Nocardioides sp. Soil796]